MSVATLSSIASRMAALFDAPADALDPLAFAPLIEPAMPQPVAVAVESAQTAEPLPESSPRGRRSGRRSYRGGFRRPNYANWKQVDRPEWLTNHQLHRIEIRFPDKPSEATRVALKSNRWRFDGESGCWFHLANDLNQGFAIQLCAAP